MNKKMKANINLKGSPCDIHKQICDNLRKMKQKEESGLLDLHAIIKELPPDKLKRLKESFRPEQPDEWEKNFNTWLTTDDINISESTNFDTSDNLFNYRLHSKETTDYSDLITVKIDVLLIPFLYLFD